MISPVKGITTEHLPSHLGRTPCIEGKGAGTVTTLPQYPSRRQRLFYRPLSDGTLCRLHSLRTRALISLLTELLAVENTVRQPKGFRKSFIFSRDTHCSASLRYSQHTSSTASGSRSSSCYLALARGDDECRYSIRSRETPCLSLMPFICRSILHSRYAQAWPESASLGEPS
jgi:hypothetical protein